jgi:hypothetical protein
VRQIIAWAKAHYRRTRTWPTKKSGPITGTLGETWSGVDRALYVGYRSLPGVFFSAAVPRAALRRSKQKGSPHLVQSILTWADAWNQRMGEWPKPKSGPIPDAPGETSYAVDAALRHEMRGLRGRSSLAQLLAKHRHVRNGMQLPRLSEAKILKWADHWHKRFGQWPKAASGSIPEASGETWLKVETALRAGTRGLPGGSSLYRLLARNGLKKEP